MLVILAIWVLLPTLADMPAWDPPRILASDIYVSPAGAAENDGRIDSPLDLATALSEHSPARLGDTIWLRGGTYHGPFVSRLEGTYEFPITVRGVPGERAILDGHPPESDRPLRPTLEVHGRWVVIRDLEVTNSHPRRSTTQSGSFPSDLRRGSGVAGHGPHLRFVNMVIHDNTTGIDLWSDSVDSEAYGNLVFFNGWMGPDRAHGHGVYTQNQTGLRRITDNIIFGQFSHGIHAYGSSAAYLDHIELRGNVLFNNGAIGGRLERDILLGGGRVATDPVLEENVTYGEGQNNLGYGAGCVGGRVSRNYFVARVPLLLVRCTPVVTGNHFFGAGGERLDALAGDHPDNTYYGERPAGTIVRIRPNSYEQGRAHIVVLNWDRASEVSVALGDTGLRPGQGYEIVDAQNYFGPPVAAGVYRAGDRVALRMDLASVATPVGEVAALPKHTAPDFAVFIVKPRVRPLDRAGNAAVARPHHAN